MRIDPEHPIILSLVGVEHGAVGGSAVHSDRKMLEWVCQCGSERERRAHIFCYIRHAGREGSAPTYHRHHWKDGFDRPRQRGTSVCYSIGSRGKPLTRILLSALLGEEFNVG